MKNFKIQEFECHCGCEMPPEARQNIEALVANVLDPVRDEYGKPIYVNSGYRCTKHNAAVGGVPRSQHMVGQAADFYVGAGESDSSRRKLLMNAFRLILTNPDIDFDQLILYPNFIHVSYVSKEKNRRGILIGRGDGKLGYGRITRSNALKINS